MSTEAGNRSRGSDPGHPSPLDTVIHLCTTAPALLGIDSSALVLNAGGDPPACVFAESEQANDVELLAFTVGEGPSLEANRVGGPILVADLASEADRWPAFAPGAVDLGVHGAFAFPLQVGAIRVGVITFYRSAPGALTDVQFRNALALVVLATRSILGGEVGRDGPAPSDPADGHGFAQGQIHQATGMIAAQLFTTAEEALIRLRARAFAEAVPIGQLSADVVARRTRFDNDPEPPRP